MPKEDSVPILTCPWAEQHVLACSWEEINALILSTDTNFDLFQILAINCNHSQNNHFSFIGKSVLHIYGL